MIAPILPKDIYMSDNAEQIKAYKDYLTENLVLSGETKKRSKHSEAYFDFEKQLAESMLDTQDNADVDKIQSVYIGRIAESSTEYGYFKNIKGFGIEV